MKKGILKEICISEKKRTKKFPVPFAFLERNYGIKGDAHAGGEREVSLLSFESVRDFKERTGFQVESGDFAENFLIKGIDFNEIEIGDLFVGENFTILEVKEKGKNCHYPCIIGKTVGECIMRKQGIFARVVKGGKIKKGEDIFHIKKKEIARVLLCKG